MRTLIESAYNVMTGQTDTSEMAEEQLDEELDALTESLAELFEDQIDFLDELTEEQLDELADMLSDAMLEELEAAEQLAELTEEQLDELSKQTMMSYMQKAEKQMPKMKDKQRYLDGHVRGEKHRTKMFKGRADTYQKELTRREKAGINKTKSTYHPNRDDNPIKDGSNDDLQQRVKYNTKDANRAARMAKSYGAKAKTQKHRMTKRQEGIKRAADRLTREEFEQLDELSKKTMMSYLQKASAQVPKMKQRANKAREARSLNLMYNRDHLDRAAVHKRKIDNPIEKDQNDHEGWYKRHNELARSAKRSADRQLKRRKELTQKIDKRREGIQRATDRLTREETVRAAMDRLREINKQL